MESCELTFFLKDHCTEQAMGKAGAGRVGRESLHWPRWPRQAGKRVRLWLDFEGRACKLC